MSLRAMLIVLNSEHLGGHGMMKFAAVCLANHANDDGGRRFPSVARIAREMGCSTWQARRHIRALMKTGFVEIEREGKAGKGAYGNSSRRYRLRLDRLATSTGATSADAGTSTGATQPLAPAHSSYLHGREPNGHGTVNGTK